MMFVAGVQPDAGGNIIIYKNKTDTEGEVPVSYTHLRAHET